MHAVVLRCCGCLACVQWCRSFLLYRCTPYLYASMRAVFVRFSLSLACVHASVSCIPVVLAQVFSVVHDLYVSYLRNPFAALAKPVESAKFRLAVDRQINDYNS